MSKKLILKTLAAALLATPLLASAESQLVVGAGSAQARLNFQIVIPRVLFLGVGQGAALPLANNINIDTVTFDYTTNPLAVSTGAAAAVVTGAAVPVRVFGNNGVIQIAVSNPATLGNGNGDTIAFTDIGVTSSDATNLNAPVMSGAPVNAVVSSGTKVTSRNATWTYAYANTAAAAAGTYTGQVTYTATMP
jgi:hypothetical protein